MLKGLSAMKRIDYIKSRSLDDIADMIDKYGSFDGSPWMEWFDRNYCQKCEPVEVKLNEEAQREFDYITGDTVECSYCELEHKCKFFPDMKKEPSNRDIIKIWLEEEV